MPRWLFIFAGLALIVTTGPPNTWAKDDQKHDEKKGKPEVVIHGTTRKAVLDALATMMVDREYSIVSIQDYKAVFEKDGGFLGSVLFGSGYDASTKKRASFDVLETGSSVRIVATFEMVSNPGSAFERRSDASKSGKAKKQIQELLDALKDQLEPTSSVPPDSVTATTPDSTSQPIDSPARPDTSGVSGQ